MSLKIYNTLSGEKEVFKPLKSGEVRMYVCGPTVYHYIHVGNARPMVFFDVVFRYLKSKGFKVTYVRNITDVDDKIIKKAEEEKSSIQVVSQKYEAAFMEDMEKLGLLKPTHSPRATDYIEAMVTWIQGLLDKKMAYNINGEILFSIDQFKTYGKLSKKN